MKKQLILGSLLAFVFGTVSYAQGPDWAGAANTTGDLYRLGKVGIGTNSGLSTPRKLQVYASGLDDGIEILSGTANNNQDAQLIFNNQTSGGHWYGFTAAGNGHIPNIPGSLSLWDATISQMRLFFDANGNAGINTQAPSAKFHVIEGSGASIRGDAIAGYGGSSVGVAANGVGNSYLGTQIGLAGHAYDGADNYCAYLTSHSGPAGVNTYGVYANIYNPQNGGNNYAVYGDVNMTMGNGAGPNYAGYFNGDVVTVGGFYFFSDKNIKKDILPVNNSISIINKLNPVTYNFDTKNNPGLALPGEKQYGFISQEIKEVLPEFTKTVTHPAKMDENGKEIYPSKEVLGLNYNGFIALLTKGMQEQQQQIEDQTTAIQAQQKQIEELKALVSSLAGNAPKAGTTTGTAIQLSDKNVIVLNQNVPNPFAESTVISYSIPSDFTKAQIIFTTLDGKVIKAVNITEKGAGTLNVFGNDLTNGTYTYTLVVDGKNIDTKKLIKE